MRRNPILLLLAMATQATSACHSEADWQRTWGEDPPPRFFKSYERRVRFEIPRNWSSRFEAFEAHGARAAERQAGAKHVLEFRYVPLDGEYRPETMGDRFTKVVTLYAFSPGQGDRLQRESPTFGTIVARTRDAVWIATLPTSNPFPPGSADARRFGEMLLTVDQVAQRLHVD